MSEMYWVSNKQKKKSGIINPQKPFRMKDGPKLKPQSRLLTAAEIQIQIYSLKN